MLQNVCYDKATIVYRTMNIYRLLLRKNKIATTFEFPGTAGITGYNNTIENLNFIRMKL